MNRRQFLMSSGGLSCVGLSTIAMSAQRPVNVPSQQSRHELTFMQWPSNRKIYADQNLLEDVQATIVSIANTIADFEPVVMLMHADDKSVAKPLLSDSVTIWDIPTDDFWARDSGPLIALDATGQHVLSHLRFNGWGNKQVHQRDSKIAIAVANRLGMKVVESGLSGEAGAIDNDGAGTLLAHLSSWIHSNRNRGLSRSDISEKLIAAYGADRVLWSAGVRGQDVTDFHISRVARFTDPGRVLINLPVLLSAENPFHLPAFDTHDVLVAADLDVEAIPLPGSPRIQQINAAQAYTDFYVLNGAVLAPEFGDEQTDAIAKDALERHFPDRNVIMMNADSLSRRGAGIQSATQQMPAKS